jgi:hypothetical protein
MVLGTTAHTCTFHAEGYRWLDPVRKRIKYLLRCHLILKMPSFDQDGLGTKMKKALRNETTRFLTDN